MRSGWKRLGILVIGLLILAVAVPSNFAQFMQNIPQGNGPHGGGPPGGGGGPPPGAGGGVADDGFSMKDDGAPNAFSDLFGLRAQQPLLPTQIRSLLPGIIFPRPTLARPADFPNPCCTSCDEASPFTVQEGGFGNGFSELYDPYPAGFLGKLFHVRRLLYTELLDPPRSMMPSNTIAFRAEYLRWYLRGPLSIPLVTTDTNPTLATFGQLGGPNTLILVDQGNDAATAATLTNSNGGPIDYQSLVGWRLTGRVATPYFPPVEIGGIIFNHTANVFIEGSTTSPVRLLAIPFQDIQPAFIIPGTSLGIETAAVIAVPLASGLGGVTGSIAVTSQIKVRGLELTAFLPLGDNDLFTSEVGIGYRYFYISETLAVNTRGGELGSIFFNTFLFPQGFITSTSDNFTTTNRFDGAQAALRTSLNLSRFALFADLKVAIGQTSSTLRVNGSSTLVPPLAIQAAQSQTVNGGILALGTNSVALGANYFSVVPELNAGLSCQITSGIRIFGGYSWLYWTTVARPGDYINRRIDSRQIPTAANFTPGAAFTGPTPTTALIPRGLAISGIFLGVEFGF